MKRIWLRTTTLFITLTFIFPYLTWAFEPSAYAISAVKSLGVHYQGKAITLPAKLGAIEKAFPGQNKTIIHIQDLHCNYEVQKNIADIIHLLAKDHGLKVVGEEGALHSVDIDPIRRFPIPEIREAVSDYFVKQGKLTGAEYYGGTGKYPIRLEGIETPKLYEDSLQAVRSFLNSEIQGYAMDLREMFDGLKPGIFNADLLELDKARTDYREGKLNVLAYATRLKNFASRYRINLNPYPNLGYYLHVGQQVFEPGVEPDQLFQEMDELDRALRESLYTSNLQREFDSRYHRLDVIEKLLNISATQEELQAFRTERDKFAVRALVKFVQQHQDGETALIDPEIHALDQSLAKVETFYHLADIRSQQFVANLMKKMDEAHENLAVIITGGFHTDEIMAELEKQHAGYLSIKPRLTKQDAVNPYFAILQGRKLPIEKLLAKNQTIMAPRVWMQAEDGHFAQTISLTCGVPAWVCLPGLELDQQKDVMRWIEEEKININAISAAEFQQKANTKLPENCEAYVAHLPGIDVPVLVTKNGVQAASRGTQIRFSNLKKVGAIQTTFADWPSLKGIAENVRAKRVVTAAAIVKRTMDIAAPFWEWIITLPIAIATRVGVKGWQEKFAAWHGPKKYDNTLALMRTMTHITPMGLLAGLIVGMNTFILFVLLNHDVSIALKSALTTAIIVSALPHIFPHLKNNLMTADYSANLLNAEKKPATQSGTVGRATKMVSRPNRLAEFDNYILNLLDDRSTAVLDVGIGYPPFPTLELADKLASTHPSIKLTGLDITLPAMVIETKQAPPATNSAATIIFNKKDDLIAVNAIPYSYSTDHIPEVLRTWIIQLKTHLLEQGEGKTYESTDGNKIVFDPLSSEQNQRSNLNYVEADVLNSGLPDDAFDVIRDFNGTLLYYQPHEVQAILSQEGRMLKEGQYVLMGLTSVISSSAELMQYRKINGKVVPTEFIFSIDPQLQKIENPGAKGVMQNSFFERNPALYEAYMEIIFELMHKYNCEGDIDSLANFVTHHDFLKAIEGGLSRKNYKVQIIENDKIAIRLDPISDKKVSGMGSSLHTPGTAFPEQPTQPLDLPGAATAAGLSGFLAVVALSVPVLNVVVGGFFLWSLVKAGWVLVQLAKQYGLTMFANLGKPAGAYNPQLGQMVNPANPSEVISQAPFFVRAHDQYAHRWVQTVVDWILKHTNGKSLAQYAQTAQEARATGKRATLGYHFWNGFVSEVLAHSLDIAAIPLAAADSLAKISPRAGAVFRFINYWILAASWLLMGLSKMQPVTFSFEPLADTPEQAVVDRLKREGVLSEAHWAEIVNRSGKNRFAACHFVAQMEDLIEGGQLESLLELAELEKNWFAQFAISNQGGDSAVEHNELQFLLEHHDTLARHGAVAFVFIARAYKDDKHTINVGGNVSKAFLLAEKFNDAISRFGILFVLAVLESRSPILQINHPNIIYNSIEPVFPEAAIAKAETFFSNLRPNISLADLLQITDALTHKAFSDPNYAMQGNLILQHVAPTLAVMQDYNLEQWLALTKYSSVQNIARALLQLGSMIKTVDIETIVQMQANPNSKKNVILELEGLHPVTWAELLAQTGRVSADQQDITLLLLKNIAALISQESTRLKIFQALLTSAAGTPQLHHVEAVLIHLLGFENEALQALNYFYKRQRSQIKRAMMIRALGWLVENFDFIPQAILLLAHENPSSLPAALNILPTLQRLQSMKIFSSFDVDQVLSSRQATASLAKLLPAKIQEAFGISFDRRSTESEAALADMDFLIDLFNFHHRYADNTQAFNQLRSLVKVYCEDGTAGVRRLKAGQDLASRQAPEKILRALQEDKNVTKLRGRSKNQVRMEVFKDFFEINLSNYDQHQKEIGTNLADIGLEANTSRTALVTALAALSKSNAPDTLQRAIQHGDLEALQSMKLTGKTQKLRNQAIGMIKKIRALEQEGAILTALKLVDQIRDLGTLPAADQRSRVQELLTSWQTKLPKLRSSLSVLRSELDRKNKPEAQLVADVLGLIQALEQASEFIQTGHQETGVVTAEISFDLRLNLKIGRFGAGGQGNCQNSTHSGTYNQSLMSFIGDPHEWIVQLRDSTGTIIGFALLHGVWTKTGEFVFIKEKVYTNVPKITRTQEDAVRDLARQVGEHLQVAVWEAKLDGSKLEVEIPETKIQERYLDSLGGSVNSYRTSYTLLAEQISGPNLVRRTAFPEQPTQPLDLPGAATAAGLSGFLAVVALSVPVLNVMVGGFFLWSLVKAGWVLVQLAKQYGLTMFANLGKPVGAYNPQLGQMVNPANPSEVISQAPFFVRAHDQYAHRWVQTVVDWILKHTNGKSLAQYAQTAQEARATGKRTPLGYHFWNGFVSEVLAHSLDIAAIPLAAAVNRMSETVDMEMTQSKPEESKAKPAAVSEPAKNPDQVIMTQTELWTKCEEWSHFSGATLAAGVFGLIKGVAAFMGVHMAGNAVFRWASMINSEDAVLSLNLADDGESQISSLSKGAEKLLPPEIRRWLNQIILKNYKLDKVNLPSRGKLGVAQQYRVVIEDIGALPFLFNLFLGRYLNLDSIPTIHLPRKLLMGFIQGKWIAARVLSWSLDRMARERFQPHAHWQTLIASHLRAADPLQQSAALILRQQVFNQTGFSAPALLQMSYEALLTPFAGKTNLSVTEEAELDARLKLLEEMNVSGFETIKFSNWSEEPLALPVPTNRETRQAIVRLLRRIGVKRIDLPRMQPPMQRLSRFLSSA